MSIDELFKQLELIEKRVRKKGGSNGDWMKCADNGSKHQYKMVIEELKKRGF